MIACLTIGLLTGTTSTLALAVWRRRVARSWVLLESWDSDDQDIVPLLDQIVHTEGEECVCGPRTIPVDCADGAVRWVYKHHSLDGREQRGALA